MRSIEVTSAAKQRNTKGEEFIPLGKLPSGNIFSRIMDKINKNINGEVSELWGTIGWEDGSPVGWTGNIEISEDGNYTSSGLTGQEVDLIKEFNQNIALSGERIKERFISFDHVDFGGYFPEKKLRLTVMLKPEESALVFRQVTDPMDSFSNGGIPEYVLPETSSEGRDRLTYFFTPPSMLDREQGKRNVIKVLTFRVQDSRYEGILRPIETAYQLLLFNPQSNRFVPMHPTTVVDKGLKTLLLIHGTANKVIKQDGTGSFADLLRPDRTTSYSWLQRIIRDGGYQQVIGFDHPTLIEEPAQNAAWLKSRLGDTPFSYPLDVITTSRGGLLGKYIANDRQGNLKIPIRRVIPVACANGVDYLTNLDGVMRWVRVLRVLAGLTGDRAKAAMVSALAQLPKDYIRNLPGLRVQCPGHPALNYILQARPVGNTVYFPVVGDFIPGNHHQLKGIFINLLPGRFLGPNNDWVVATQKQCIMPPGYYAYGMNLQQCFNRKVDAVHGQYFHPDFVNVRQEMFDFLTRP